jgi:Cu/Zn superoxide dismutase
MPADRPGPGRSHDGNRRRSVFCCVAVGLAVASAMATAAPAEARHADDRVDLTFAGALVDFAPLSTSPFDDASARLVMAQHASGTTFVLILSGVSKDAAGQTFGAHLHSGPCVAGSPLAAGPHYNQSVVEGAVPTVVSDDTEVWLDFTVRPGGTASSVALVPFAPAPGDRSIVVHAEATEHNGTAGPRLACLPVTWS